MKYTLHVLLLTIYSFAVADIAQANTFEQLMTRSDHIAAYVNPAASLALPTEIKRRTNPLDIKRLELSGKNELHFFAGHPAAIQSLYEEITDGLREKAEDVLLQCHGHDGGCGFYTPREFIRSPGRRDLYARHLDIYNLHRHDYKLFTASNYNDSESHALVIHHRPATSDVAYLALDIIESASVSRPFSDHYERLEPIDQASGPIEPMRVYFAESKATIEPSSLKTLEAMAQKIVEQPSREFVVAGHTDHTGDSEGNSRLARNRAEAVHGELLKLTGGAPNLKAFTAHGSEQPIADNRSKEGRAKNRRVELIIRPTNMN